jgi:hypothetical protein
MAPDRTGEVAYALSAQPLWMLHNEGRRVEVVPLDPEVIDRHVPLAPGESC